MIDTDRVSATKIPKWRYEQIEREVVRLYRKVRQHAFPADPFKIIEKIGYVLIPYSRFDEETRQSFIKKGKDAFSFFNPKIKNYVIVYDDEKPLTRIRFTLMHEIGHICLGHRLESDLARREADYFAGYALAPSPLIGEYASAGFHEVSSKFWVSLECAEICYSRYSNWVQFGDNHLKDYEIILLSLIKQL